MGSTDAFNVLLENALHLRVAGGSHRSVSGGSINVSLRVDTDRGPIFVKRGSAEVYPRFETEARGLQLLSEAQAIRVPQVLGCAHNEHDAFIALEWIELSNNTRSSEATLGEQLAWQHRVLESRFGLDTDNTIGATLHAILGVPSGRTSFASIDCERS